MINLRRDFENLKMKEAETMKQYSNRIMAMISSLEDSRDLLTISFSELINVLYALEQRWASKEEGHVEGDFQARNRDVVSFSRDVSIFKNVDKRFHSKVKVENDQYIEVVGKGDVLIKTPSGTKLVTDILLVLDID
ncbi:golgin subfamily A member 3-like [Gossypium australe]|uniref:Golgin subfamily A member 3-like n=1 Tax=Gossypium australe TaxID=47621 RepID=A0A5B6X1B5_9ROSI|nr:golgin subfamily A member 3-like [Gossypium australe]